MAQQSSQDAADPQSDKDKIERCRRLIERRFNKSVADHFVEQLENLEWEEDFNELKDDLEDAADNDDWESSTLMDALVDADPQVFGGQQGETVFKFLLHTLDPNSLTDSDAHVLSPSDLDWESQSDAKLQEAAEYMNRQCPNAGFQASNQNKNLLRAFAVGKANNLPVMGMFMDIYELAHMDEVISARKPPRFKNEDEWALKCKGFFAEFKGREIVRQALKDFRHRLAGSGMNSFVANKIQDDINVYIAYTLKINNAIANLLDTDAQSPILPLQVDLVILGRDQKDQKEEKDVEEEDSDGDDDDLGDDFLGALMSSSQTATYAPLNNPLPEEGIAAILEREKITLQKSEISLRSTTRAIQDLLLKQIGDKRRQRVVVVIDRSSGRGCDEDMIYVYQLPAYDEVLADCCEEHMSWMAKKQIFPDWDRVGKDLAMYKGGEMDIGDAGFVVSFHVHEAGRVKVEQFIKTQKMPFLPCHMVDVWPMYFEGKAAEVNGEKYSVEKIYEAWKLPTRNAMLNKWIKCVDPTFFKQYEAKHLRYEKKPQQ